MPLDAHLSRAQMLISQNRHEMAEQEIQQSIAQSPESFLAHGLLAICLAEQEKHQEATQSAQRAIGFAPDESYSHYALAYVLQKRNRHREALQPLQEAIRIDPYDDHMFATLANLHLGLKEWREALYAADQGLAIDPENTDCINIKSIAQIKLGQKAEAEASITTALNKDPDDPQTHANLGWAKLESGKHKEALEHFREAMRLDPSSDFARDGILEAMRSRNFVYRLLLRYFLFMAKLTDRAQWAVIIGFYILYRILREVGRNNPAAAPFVTPILVVYVVFAVLTWIAEPLMNLVLRFDKFGKLVLNKQEIRTSNAMAFVLVVSIGSLIAYFAGAGSLFLLIALVVGVMIFPVSKLYQCQPGWPRQVGLLYAAGMALMGTAILVLPFAAVFLTDDQGTRDSMIEFSQSLILFHVIAAFLSQFLYGWLATQHVRY